MEEAKILRYKCNLVLGILCLISFSLNSETVSADEEILKQFETHKIVALGISHWQKNEADFLLKLVRNPGFAEKVRNIVIEDGNALYQGVLDRYIAGEDISFDQLKPVWQNTTQPGRGDAPQHRELLKQIHQINKKLPSLNRIRVLAGDPPIDWATIREPKDIAPFFNERDLHFCSVVFSQVLAKNQNALLVIGSGHVMRKPVSYAGLEPDTSLTITNLIEKKYPHSVFVIIPHEDFGSRTAELEPKFSKKEIPSFYILQKSWIGELDASVVYTGKILRIGMDPIHPAAAYPGLKLKDLADGYLYMGPIASIARVEWQPEHGTKYAAEIARRDSLIIKLTMPNAAANGGGVQRIRPRQ